MLSNIDGLFQPFDVELSADGSLYVTHLEERTLRRMHPDGRIEVLFDRSAGIVPVGVAARADGTVFVTDVLSMSVIRIVTAAMPGIAADDIAVPSRDGSVLYVFDHTGRHRETRDALTGVTLLAFTYDDHGRVVTVTDRDGLFTRIERDETGRAKAVVGPYGQRTHLIYDDIGNLEYIRNPLQREIVFGYDNAGRLTSMQDARGGQHDYDYDERGRLVTDTGPTGYTQTLTPADALHGSDVAVTTSRNRVTRYELERTSTDEVVRTTHLPWGVSGTVRKRAGRTATTSPDGTTSEFTLASDPRWQSQAPWARTARVRTPQGRTFEATSQRTLAFNDPAHPHRVTSLEQHHTINGRTTTARYDAAARTITSQNPGSQQRTVTLDELGRVLRIDQAGFAPYIVGYYDDGRLETVQHGEGAGARITLFRYDANGHLFERIDPLQRTQACALGRRALPRAREVTG